MIAAIAAFTVVFTTGCGGSKQVSNGQISSSGIDQQIELKKKQMELDALNADAEIQKKQQEMRIKDIESEAAQREQKIRQMVKGEQRTLIFCMDEAFDKAGEYMGGLGVVEARPDRTHAILDANRAAVADIATRYIGDLSQEATGGWVGYVAVHVLLADAKKGLADELEVRHVDYDKKKFFDKMDAELKADEDMFTT